MNYCEVIVFIVFLPSSVEIKTRVYSFSFSQLFTSGSSKIGDLLGDLGAT